MEGNCCPIGQTAPSDIAAVMTVAPETQFGRLENAALCRNRAAAGPARTVSIGMRQPPLSDSAPRRTHPASVARHRDTKTKTHNKGPTTIWPGLNSFRATAAEPRIWLLGISLPARRSSHRQTHILQQRIRCPQNHHPRTKAGYPKAPAGWSRRRVPRPESRYGPGWSAWRCAGRLF